MSGNPKRNFAEAFAVSPEKIQDVEAVVEPLTLEQEAVCNQVADQCASVFDNLSSLRDSVEEGDRPIMAIFFQTALKENSRIQDLLVQIRESAQEDYDSILEQIQSELKGLVDTENAALSRVKELGYDVDFNGKKEIETEGVIPDAEKIPEVVVPEPVISTSSSVETDSNIEHIEGLADRYKSLDSGVFYDAEGYLKKIDLIEKEIKLVVKLEGFDTEKINWFLNEIHAALNLLKDAERDVQESRRGKFNGRDVKNSADKVAKNTLKELSESVHAFLQMEAVDRENSQEAAEVESVVPDVDEEISKVTDDYEASITEAMSIGFDADTSFEVVEINRALQGLINNHRETDKIVARNNKVKYLKKISYELAELKQDIEAFKKSQSELPPVERVSDSEQITVQSEEVPENVSEPVVSEVLNTEAEESASDEIKLDSVDEKSGVVFVGEEKLNEPTLVEGVLEGREKTIDQFKKFAEENRDRINTELGSFDKDALANFIYHEFYGQNESSKKYVQSHPEVQALMDEYNDKSEVYRGQLIEKMQDGSKISFVPHSYWTDVAINGGVKKNNVGRFYINTRPNDLHGMFDKIINLCADKGITCDAKFPTVADEQSFNRVDKMVLYFNAADDAAVLSILEEITNASPEAFEEAIPKFTAAIPGVDGKNMPGIGFGEEPRMSGTSFGITRSEILQDVCREAQSKNLEVTANEFDFDEAFKRISLGYGVDMNNPSFNSNQDDNNFSEIKLRLNLISQKNFPTETPYPSFDASEYSGETPLPASEIATEFEPVDEKSGVVFVGNETEPGSKEVVPITPVENSEKKVLPEGGSYKEVREHWTTKDTFKQKESEYRNAMEAFYQDKSIGAKARNTINGVSKLFGFKPVLSDSLQKLQNEYKENRQLYAESLDGAIKERSYRFAYKEGRRTANDSYSSDSDSTKIAFARKFILQPNEEMLRLQSREIMSPENKARLMRVMEVMKKYKWPLRIGMVVGAAAGAATAATAAGVATAGVAVAAGAGGGLKAARIAASVTLGGLSGLSAKKLTQGKVDTARSGFEKAKQDVGKNFTLDDLNKLEAELQSAEFNKTRAENIQKTAVIGSAVATGLAGYEASSYFDGADVSEIETEVTDTPSVPEASVAEVVETVVPQKFTLGEFSVSHEGVNGHPDFSTILHGVKLEGANLDVLSEANKAQIQAFVKLSVDDILYSNPYIKEANLERIILDRMNNKFGDTVWLSESKISKIDIGTLEVKQSGLTEALVESELNVNSTSEASHVEEIEVSQIASNVENPNTPSVESEVVREYEIKNGDNLWNITKNQFGDKLKGLSIIEQNEVIDRTLDKIQANPDLMKSIGIKEDVDEIYAGEKLNLTALETEVDRVIERNSILDDFRKSAPIMVESDAGARDVPISFKVKTAPEVVEINAQPSGKVAVDPVPPFEEVAKKPSLASLANEPKVSPIAPFEKAPTSASVEVVNVPDIKPLNGEYYSHPEYKKYITQTYGSVDKFDGVVRKAVTSFDNNTYDIFQRMGTNYESPYSLLQDATLKDVAEYKNPDNLAELKTLLREENIKYETYLAWMDLIDSMKKSLPSIETTKVSDLFSRYVAESAKGTFPFSSR